MSANVVRFDGDAHAACEALLPWYAMGQVDAAERAELEAHLAGCAPCRASLARERELQRLLAEALPDPPYRGDVGDGLAALRKRIGSQRQAAGASWGSRLSTVPSWWRGVLLAQAALIGLLLVLLLWPRAVPDGALYRGLGPPAADASALANAVVSFAPDASEAQLRAALRAANARLVGGPTASEAYLVALPVGDADALARLRAQPGVVLAVSLESGSAR